jgi:ABC-type nitrate/sulfonate/bicarbonate transport system substrate-binding protein
LLRAFGLLLIAALAAAAGHPAFAQGPVKIRAGWITTPASLVPLLFLKPGVAKHHGKSYTFEPIYFSSSTLQITALSQGELDVAGFGYTKIFPIRASSPTKFRTALRVIIQRPTSCARIPGSTESRT